MSAWIVSKAHIDVLVTGLVRSEVVASEGLTPDQLGQALWEENHRSVNYRYGEDTPTPEYRHEAHDVSPVVLLKQIGCYDYQSCEHPGWIDSDAKRWSGKLYLLLAGRVDTHTAEYDEAPWGIA